MSVDSGYPYQMSEKNYAFVKEGDNLQITVTASSTGSYSRYIYLYINDVNQGYRTFTTYSTRTWSINIDNNEFVSIEFRVYVPCSYCTEQWNIEQWFFKDSFSWRAHYIPEITIHTDYNPASSVRIDMYEAAKQFSQVIWDATEQQVFVKTFRFKFNYINRCSSVPCSNEGNINIYNGVIPHSSGDTVNPFAFLGIKAYYASETPNEFYGVSGNNKWENINKRTFWQWDRIYSFMHEFGHSYFSLPDQYAQNDVKRIMGSWGGFEGRTSEFTSRRNTGGFNSIPPNQQSHFPNFDNDWDWLLNNMFPWMFHPEPVYNSMPSNLYNQINIYITIYL
jgi:hypothetical protein